MVFSAWSLFWPEGPSGRPLTCSRERQETRLSWMKERALLKAHLSNAQHLPHHDGVLSSSALLPECRGSLKQCLL